VDEPLPTATTSILPARPRNASVAVSTNPQMSSEDPCDIVRKTIEG
jgi:hypothetical protein